MENPKELVKTLLETARTAVETALSVGKEHNIPVNLNIVGLGDPGMWYVSLDDKRQELMDSITYGGHTPTQEELQEVEDELKHIEENGGYDNWGSKVTGWMSSSTNC